MSKICSWCGDPDAEVEEGYDLCEECDSDTVECSICEERQGYDSHCRHVFRDEQYEWNGSGGYADPENVNGSFLKLCELMPKDFPLYLFQAIKAGGFYTWLVAPMIGGGGNLTLNGLPCRYDRCRQSEWLPEYGKAMVEIGEGDHSEETADGYHWLASLYKDKTPAANAQTLHWLMLAMGRRKQ